MTNEGAPLTDTLVKLTDRFERSRLALLTYSSITTLLAVASGRKDVVAPLGLGFSFDSLTLMCLLWTVSAVYFVVFCWFEAPAVEALNWEVVRRAGGKVSQAVFDGINEQFNRVKAGAANELLALQLESERVVENIRQLSRGSEDLGSWLQAITSRMKFATTLDENSLNHNSGDSEGATLVRLGRELAHAVEKGEEVEAKVTGLAVELPEYARRMEEIGSAYAAAINRSLDQLRTDLTALSAGLSSRETTRLRFWDVRAPKILWWICTVAAASALIVAAGGYRLPDISIIRASTPITISWL